MALEIPALLLASIWLWTGIPAAAITCEMAVEKTTQGARTTMVSFEYQPSQALQRLLEAAQERIKRPLLVKSHRYNNMVTDLWQRLIHHKEYRRRFTPVNIFLD